MKTAPPKRCCEAKHCIEILYPFLIKQAGTSSVIQRLPDPDRIHMLPCP